MNKKQWERIVKKTRESFERWSVSASMNWEGHASQISTEAWATKQCRDAYIQGDATGIFLGESGGTYLRFLWDNAFRLKQRGIYEPALVCAYRCATLGFSGWQNDYVAYLFALADMDKLREAGDPIPPGESFTLYRGVSGPNKHHRTFPSWTSDYWTAAWFAVRLYEKNPALMQADIKREDILFYIDGSEKEFVVMCPPEPKILEVDWAAVGKEAQERHLQDLNRNGFCNREDSSESSEDKKAS